MRPEKLLSARVMVIYGNKKRLHMLANPASMQIHSDSLIDGLITRDVTRDFVITPFHFPVIGLGWHLMYQTLHVNAKTTFKWERV